MGVKAFKEHFGIEHIVQMTSEGLCIGSSYVPDLITVGLDGRIVHRSIVGETCETLNAYEARIKADPDKAKELIHQPDEHGDLVTIYTYDGGGIIEKQCEVPEWPNTTTDGEMIYENTHSTDRDQVVEWAKRNAEAWRTLAAGRVEECEQSLQEAKSRLAEAVSACDQLGVV